MIDYIRQIIFSQQKSTKIETIFPSLFLININITINIDQDTQSA